MRCDLSVVRLVLLHAGQPLRVEQHEGARRRRGAGRHAHVNAAGARFGRRAHAEPRPRSLANVTRQRIEEEALSGAVQTGHGDHDHGRGHLLQQGDTLRLQLPPAALAQPDKGRGRRFLVGGRHRCGAQHSRQLLSKICTTHYAATAMA
eukprot:scaffold18929_cov107-Isochrysis_galbana.AAC.1